MDSTKDSPQVDDKNLSEQEKKKLRNRLSQRAFRRRQAEYVRELRNRVNTDQRPDSDRVEALQEENRRLRQQLVDVQAKMSRLLATMQQLSDSVSKTLDDASGGKLDVQEKEAEPPESTGSMQKQMPHGAASQTQWLDLEPFDTALLDFNPSVTQPLNTSTYLHGDSFSSSELINVAGTNPLYTQIPNIWSFEYQMGMLPYMNAMNATEESSLTLRKDWSSSNSPFSDHIALLQQMLRSKLNISGYPEGRVSLQSLYQPVLMVLAMFNSITRPDVMAWYAKTRFYHIVELTAWQLFPSPTTFEKVHPQYRPTETQLKHPHPRVIDWIPFPTLRDRLIQLHAANPHLDQIFCDAVTGYVVEALMSDLILGAPQITIYLRVTDLITVMSSAPRGNESEIATLPAPDITTLFSSPAYARAAFKQLNMDRGVGYYKIDPAFFEKYPELHGPSGDVTATGIPLKPKFQKILTYPRPLDSSTVETYRSFIDFSLDAANTICMACPN